MTLSIIKAKQSCFETLVVNIIVQNKCFLIINVINVIITSPDKKMGNAKVS